MISGATRVLVVDDDANVRGALVEMLRSNGLAVAEAGDGAAALDLLQSGPRPSLILLDLMMPRMDARAFRREQAKHPALRHIATVVLTGSLVDREALGRELGGVTVMAKPVRYDDLIALVSRHCAHAA